MIETHNSTMNQTLNGYLNDILLASLEKLKQSNLVFAVASKQKHTPSWNLKLLIFYTIFSADIVGCLRFLIKFIRQTFERTSLVASLCRNSE